MEGIKAAAEHLQVTVTVQGIDWADDELVAELGDLARSYLGDGLDHDRELQAMAQAVVVSTIKEQFEERYHPDIEAGFVVKLESLTGPGGWPTISITGPIVLVDRVMESYFDLSLATQSFVEG